MTCLDAPQILLLTLFILILIKLLQRTRAGQRRGKAIPGPAALPVIGNLHQLSKRPFIQLTDMKKKFGDIFKLRLGSWDVVVLNGEETIREAFLQHSAAFAGRPPFPSFKHIIAGKSLTFNSYSQTLKEKRKVLIKTLDIIGKKPGYLENLISASSLQLCDDFIASRQQLFDPGASIMLHHTKLMLNILLGKTDELQSQRDAEALKDLHEELVHAAFDFLPYDVLPWILKILRNASKRIEIISCNLFKQMKKITDPEPPGGYHDGSALQIIKDLGLSEGKFSETEVRDELLLLTHDIIGASMDTVASTMSWMVLYLAKYPEMQESIWEEMQQKATCQQRLGEADMGNMPYSMACIYEIYRHAAVMPLAIPHYTLQDTNLRGYDIPKDTVVLANIYAGYRDENIWEDPDAFKPRRFLLGESGSLIIDKSKVGKLQMFGVGKRRCVGQHIAMLELFIFFTTVVCKCVIKESPEHALKLSDSLFAVSHCPGPYEVIVTERL